MYIFHLNDGIIDTQDIVPLICAFLLQPAFLIALFSTKEKKDLPQSNDSGLKHPENEALIGPLESIKPNMIDAVLLYVGRSDDLINRYCLDLG